MTPLYRFLFITGFLLGNNFLLFSQNVVNNGAGIIVMQGANVVIGGSYINNNDGLADGTINLDGDIYLRRNWINNSNGEVLISVGLGNTGNVIMDGSQKQYIDGTHSSIFENLVVKNAKKTLKVTDCKVNDTLFLDAVFDLNANRIVILKNNPIAIKHLSSYILSETNTIEGLGEVEWKIGSVVDTFSVPFGSGFSSTADLMLTLETKTPAFPPTGSIRFATYPTECQNNPLPPDVSDLGRSFEYVADRFWNINPLYDDKPDVSILLTYLSDDIDYACNNGLEEVSMKAYRHNTLQHTWSDIQPLGILNESNNTVFIENLKAADFFAPWCLANEVPVWEIFLPNAFTPNGDGLNDFFSPIGLNLDKMELNMYIFDRWGGLIYRLDDLNKPWNGCFNNGSKPCMPGVYTWTLKLTETDGHEHQYKGIVSLIK